MTGLLIAAGLAAVPGLPAPQPTQVLIDVRVLHGDPLGSPAEGTVKRVAEPRFVVVSGQPAAFLGGGQYPLPGPDGAVEFQPFGVQLRFTPVVRLDGAVHLVVAAELHERVPDDGGARADGTGSVGYTTRAVRTTRVLSDGQAVRCRIAAKSPAEQMWAEVTVRVPPPAR